MTRKNSDAHQKAVIDHYTRPGLESLIESAYEQANMHHLAHADTAPLDEFHIRGRTATRELAELAGLKSGMTVLDLGCGIGGPARTLAAEYGCFVTGVDIMKEYCRTAAMLTGRLGLQDRVSFHCRDMMTHPFKQGEFDAVWTIHTIMNIENKELLFNNIHRTLKPSGVFSLYEICAGGSPAPVYPVPWANDASINFLVDIDSLRNMLIETGFDEIHWIDVTGVSLSWYERQVARRRTKTEKAAFKPGIDLVMGETTREKMENVVRNMREDRIRVVQGVFRKTG